MSETFRVVPSTTPRPAVLSAVKRHARVEDALAVMGEGVVIGVTTATGGPVLRLVAFHQTHLGYVERTAGVVRRELTRACDESGDQ